MQRKPRCLLATALFGWLAVCSTIVTAADSPPSATRKSPDWLRSAVVYEIFPRNFSKEGDLNAITAHLDELKDLGVDVLWLMPIHPTGEKMKKGACGSPFAVRDFYAINPDYGTTNDFKRLIDETHKRGMKLIMDIVAGQTAWDSVLMEHPDFYKKDTNGAIIPPNPAWTDVAGLNYTNPEVRRYMTDMMKYWLRDFGVDGFRWSFFYTLDLVMSSAAPVSYLKESWDHTYQQYPKGALHLRFSDSHEQTRSVARHGMDGALAAQVLMLTLDGVPLFYNGMEVGDATESSDPALFEKIPVFWHPGGRPPLRDIYRDLIKLRKQYPAFSGGDVTWISNSAPVEVVSFLRTDKTDEFLVLINLTNHRTTGSVELANAEGFAPVKISGRPVPLDPVSTGFNLDGNQWFIYHRAVPKTN